MIKKMRKRTLKLVKLEVLSRRLLPNHPKRKYIESDLAKLEAGYKGEKALDYFLELITDKEMLIFHDIRLPIIQTKYYFQIDTLIVSPYFIAVVEVKNINGNIYFDHLADQIIRTLNGEQEAFKDPVNQAGRQSAHLTKLLQHKQFQQIPIEHLACFTNSVSVITFSNKYPEKSKLKVIRPRNLTEKLEHFKLLHPHRIYSKNELKKLSSFLLKNHTDNETDILSHYQLQKQEIITGVQCGSCSAFSLQRCYGNWRCPSCHHTQSDAHIQALYDYSFLFSPFISNKEARLFLHVPSSHTAMRVLQSMRLPSEGKGSTYRYILRE